MERQNRDYVVVWEFWVRAEAESQFEGTYGPRGPGWRCLRPTLPTVTRGSSVTQKSPDAI
jgi:hypothetical protein